jgi:hypothetical protein
MSRCSSLRSYYSASLRMFATLTICLVLSLRSNYCAFALSLRSIATRVLLLRCAHCNTLVFVAALHLLRFAAHNTNRCAHSIACTFALLTMLFIRCAHSVLSCSLRSHVVSIRCAHVNTPCSLCTECARYLAALNTRLLVTRAAHSCLDINRCAHMSRLTRAGALVELRSACYF